MKTRSPPNETPSIPIDPEQLLALAKSRLHDGGVTLGWPLVMQIIDGLRERDALRETARLAERFARAKGRHHSQHAMCDLLEHFDLPAVRPGNEPEMATCACGDQFPPDSYGAGFMGANGGICENCAAAEGGERC